jgi:hypothetical protein
MKADEFKLGDKVWCVTNGEGIVTSTYDGELEDYPILVNFGTGDTEYHDYYTEDGKLRKYGQRCLFFSKPTVTGETQRPFTPSLVGKDVIVIFKKSNVACRCKILNETAHDIEVTYSYRRTMALTKQTINIVEITKENLITFD